MATNANVLLDDEFSLFHAHLDDAWIEVLGTDSGWDSGNPEPEQQVVAAFLRNDAIVHIDNWTGREFVIPLAVKGLSQAARDDMAARIKLALKRAKKLTVIPDGEMGAPSWFRIQWARFDKTPNDLKEKNAKEQAWTIRLGVNAWAKSMDVYTTTGDNAIEASTIYDYTLDGTTGWAAINGTLDGAAVGCVGMQSDGSSATRDTLRNSTLMWDPAGYALITIEAKVNPYTGGGAVGESGSLYPDVIVYSHGVGDTSWNVVTTGPVLSREALGSGWYAETRALAYGLPALEGLQIVSTGGDLTDQDLKVRKVTLEATNTSDVGTQTLWLDIPGSEATAGDITVSPVGGGVLVYTPEAFADYPDYHPRLGTGGPEGTYHLVIDASFGDAAQIDWAVGDQSGSVKVADLDWTDGLVCIANDISLPEGGGTVAVTAPGATTFSLTKSLLLWVGDPLTGETAGYTMTGPPSGSSTDALQIVAPTAKRPVTTWLVGGVYDPDVFRMTCEHEIDPGRVRLFVAWAGATVPATAAVTWSGHPAWHTNAVPPHRWPQTP